MNGKSDIEYASEKIIDTIDCLAIDDILRAKLMCYIYKSLESEEILDSNCLVLDQHYKEKKEGKVLCLRKRTQK